jgi:hypothetical protein
MGRDHLGYLDVDGKITSQRSQRNRMCGCGLHSTASGQYQVAGSRQYDNEPSGFITGREFLDHLYD